MNKELAAIKDAVDTDTGEGADHPAARKLADAMVKAQPEVFASFEDMSLEQCVQAVDVFRAANMLDEQWRVEAWLLHRFEAQLIPGGANPKVRNI